MSKNLLTDSVIALNIKRLFREVADLKALEPLVGTQGPRGKTGETGKPGRDGSNGIDGKPGLDGVDGPQGLTGEQGPTGPTGPTGDTGEQGPKGDTGPTGERGLVGEQGPAGVAGRNGTDGVDGKDGIDGKDGSKGDVGSTGPAGVAGPAGKDGSAGLNGKDGKDGANGTNGIDGKDGSVGLTGPAGPKGIDGKDGVNGVNGRDGVDGKDAPAVDIEPHIKKVSDDFFKWRENVNKSLMSMGGGGSYKILDNADVEKVQLSDAVQNAILIFDVNKQKFQVTDINEVLQSLQYKMEAEAMYSRLIDNAGDNVYIGEANPGSSETSASWRIKRIYTDPNTDDVDILWASGSAAFDKVWANRTTYTYS